MMLLTKPIMKQLKRNYEIKCADPDAELTPVVKLFTPWANATWLFTDIDPDGDTLFGLCDLGLGFPELGYASLSEMAALRGIAGLKIERDRYFEANKTIMAYWHESQDIRRIAA